MAAGLGNGIDHGPREKMGQDGGGGAATPEPSPRGTGRRKMLLMR